MKNDTTMTLPDGTKEVAKQAMLEIQDIQSEKKTKIEAKIIKNVKHEIYLGEKDLIKMKK